jgi:hypothetical protein
MGRKETLCGLDLEEILGIRHNLCSISVVVDPKG